MKRRDWEVIAGIALVYVVLESLGVTCPIRYLTGVSCAGCGMSRAWLCLLRLDAAGALAYHPLFWLPVPAALVLLLRKKLPARLYRGLLAAVCGLFLVVYVVRLLSPGDPVVVFRPREGLIGRVLAGVLARI